MLEDNILDKKLLNYIEERAFSKKSNVNQISKKLIKFYAKNFHSGDEK